MMNTKILELLGILLQTSYCLCQMRKTIKVEKLPFPSAGWGDRAANLSLNVGDQKEVTLCFKFRTFAYNEGSSNPFSISSECPDGQTCADSFGWMFQIKWKSGRDKHGKQAVTAFSSFRQDNPIYNYETVLQRTEKPFLHNGLFEDWIDLFEWQSLCYSWSVLKKKEVLYINGKFILGFNWSKQFKRGWSDYPLRLNLMENWRGEATDLNIYDSFFEEAELVSWTTSCGVPEKGRILSWEPEDYTLTNNEEIETVISEVASDDLCLNQKEGIDVFEIFDNGLEKSAFQAELGCQRLNGQLVMTPTNEKEAHEILKHFREYAIKKNFTGGERSKYLNYRLGGRSDLEGTEFMETDDGYNFYPKGGKYVLKDPSTDIILGTQFAAEPSAGTYSEPTEMCFYCGWHTTSREISPQKRRYIFKLYHFYLI